MLIANDWTDWLDIEVSANFRKPAVYKVRLIDSDGNRCKLARLLKVDKEGTMCIGHTGDMEQRRKQFLTALKKAYGHSSMNLVYYLWKYSSIFREKFKSAKFQYSFCRCSSVYKAKNCESDLIKSYFKKFGEVPPLNSSIPNRYKDW